MSFLLDTHVLIWAMEDSPKLSPTARVLIEDVTNNILVSAVSAWEIAIKKSKGQLKTPNDLDTAVRDLGFFVQDLRFSTHVHLEHLPFHHRDPFDRMLIAQAIAHDIPLITNDRELKKYPIEVIW